MKEKQELLYRIAQLEEQLKLKEYLIDRYKKIVNEYESIYGKTNASFSELRAAVESLSETLEDLIQKRKWENETALYRGIVTLAEATGLAEKPRWKTKY